MADLKSNLEWKLWGKDDPLFGVASWDKKQKGAELEWTDEEFYALGESDWHDFVSHWRHYGVNQESCLEVGCGAGRMTRQLALFFTRVYAVDVSEAMIDYARRRIDCHNVKFSVVDGLILPHKDCSVKSLFSTHVLQHLDSIELGFTYFREFFRVLDSGGSLMVHMPLYQWPIQNRKATRLFEGINSIAQKINDLRAQAKRMRSVKIMRGTAYPLLSLNTFLQDLGFHRVEFRTFPTTSNGGLHSFVLAEKR